LSRAALNQVKVTQTAAAGFSRNNFEEEENLSQNKLEKLQTVETPFKMKDVTKFEKFERISSLKNFSEDQIKSRKMLITSKIIGNSFLGSNNMKEEEFKYGRNEIGPHSFKAH
jgi:hypothetical protein